jgi:EAL domain-containing protein (putative c-di-GMP-specific phosphodiesterase class I)
VTPQSLRHGLLSDAFSLVYQPIVSLVQPEVAGVEALVRWLDPSRGLLDPGAFVPDAEKSGLIIPLGMRVLADACRHTQSIRHREGRDPLRVSVNVSACQLLRPGLLQSALAVLIAELGIKPSEVVLEVTESHFVAEGTAAMAGVYALHELGVGLAIDDFGIGSTSLRYLKTFPPGTALKIDRFFLRGLPDDPRDRGIVGGIAAMATALGLDTVAEGVERAEQVEVLAGLGCVMAQGNLFAPPLRLGELAAVLRRLEPERPGVAVAEARPAAFTGTAVRFGARRRLTPAPAGP